MSKTTSQSTGCTPRAATVAINIALIPIFVRALRIPRTVLALIYFIWPLVGLLFTKDHQDHPHVASTRPDVFEGEKT